jgi:hypothetical protein
MHNIVDFRTGRSRPRRSITPPSDGAQILFFTGVRYERDHDIAPPSFVPEATLFQGADTMGSRRSEGALDLTAH